MIKTAGKIHDDVVQELQSRGLGYSDIKVATFSRGPDHVIISGEDAIGEYNHVSKKLVIYDTFLKAE